MDWIHTAWQTPLPALVAGTVAWAGAVDGQPVAVTPRDLVGVAGVPAIVGLVELVKWVFPELPARVYPVLALAFGVGINLSLMGYSGAGVVEAVAVGVVAALMASGLYSQAKVYREARETSERREGGSRAPTPSLEDDGETPKAG